MRGPLLTHYNTNVFSQIKDKSAFSNALPHLATLISQSALFGQPLKVCIDEECRVTLHLPHTQRLRIHKTRRTSVSLPELIPRGIKAIGSVLSPSHGYVTVVCGLPCSRPLLKRFFVWLEDTGFSRENSLLCVRAR